MKREELKQHSGKPVTIILDGKEETSAVILRVDGPSAYLVVPMPKPGEAGGITKEWELTDADVEGLESIDSGGGSLIGPIYLKRDGDSLKWDADSQPD